MSLRTYQTECLQALTEAHQEGVSGSLVNLPTGAGKTLIAGHLHKQLPRLKTLFLVGSEELVWQARDKFSLINPSASVGVEKAEYTSDPSASDVIVASIQSLSRKNRLERFRPDTFGVICIDEAHHFTVSGMYADVLRHFHALKSESNFNTDTLLYGVTATVNRTDGAGLEAGFSRIVYQRSLLDLMRQGVTIDGKLYPYITDIRCFRVDSYTDLSGVHVKGGDLDTSDLQNVIDNPERNKIVVESYQNLGEGLPAFAFTCSVAHSHHLAEEFNKRGTSAAVMSGNTGPEERRRLFEAFDLRELQVICSTAVLGEGVDRERASVAIMARPHKASLPFVQKVGRVVRPSPGPEVYQAMRAQGRKPEFLKPYAIVIDVVDQAGRHSLMTTPSLFGLRGDMNMEGRTALEVLDEVEEREKQTSLDLRQYRSLAEMKAAVEQVDLFAPPVTPPEIRRCSQLAWLRTSPGHYCLSLAGHKSVRIAENLLGLYEIFTYDTGIRHHRWTSGSLPEAIHDAEKYFVPQHETIFLRDSAAWHRDMPTENQTLAVYRGDARVRSAHKSAREFHEYALREFHKGNATYSKGSISKMISSLATARPAWLQRKIEERKKAV